MLCSLWSYFDGDTMNFLFLFYRQFMKLLWAFSRLNWLDLDPHKLHVGYFWIFLDRCDYSVQHIHLILKWFYFIYFFSMVRLIQLIKSSWAAEFMLYWIFFFRPQQPRVQLIAGCPLLVVNCLLVWYTDGSVWLN